MTDQTQAQAALARELARIRRLRKQPIHPGYAAIVAKAHSLGLPHLYATDITIHDRLLIAERQPRQFAWLLHEGGSLLSTLEPNERPLDYLHATRRTYGHALPFWWNGTSLMWVTDIEELITHMAAACAELQRKAEDWKKRHTPQRAATPNTTKQPDPASTPITPAGVMSQTCACCGAILPLPLSRLDAIAGQEHLRRAVTVALTGNHPITFLGSGATLADALAFGRIARHYGVTAYVTTPCICANAGDPYAECRCSPEAIGDWRRRSAFQAALYSDIVVEAAHTSAEQRMAHRRGRRSEPDEQLIAQAAEARSRPRPSDELDGASQRLLAAAIRQLQLTTEQVMRMLSVAQSLAQLADQLQIQPVHLAEALQYRPRIAPIVDLLEPDRPADRTMEE